MPCYLNIWTNNNELKEKYIEHINRHNEQTFTNYPNAGFDLLCPEQVLLNDIDTKFKLDTEIICSMKDNNNKPISYYLYPRSSIIKTNLRLANSVGIIDSGYLGNIIGIFDKIDSNVTYIDKYSRLLQICSPTLSPIYVKIIENKEDFGTTERGTGGFGSTG